MATQKQKFCRTCDRKTLCQKQHVESGCLMHVLLSVITFGLWIPFAMLMVGMSSLSDTFAQYRCQTCGSIAKPPRRSATWYVFITIVYATLGWLIWNSER